MQGIEQLLAILPILLLSQLKLMNQIDLLMLCHNNTRSENSGPMAVLVRAQHGPNIATVS